MPGPKMVLSALPPPPRPPSRRPRLLWWMLLLWCWCGPTLPVAVMASPCPLECTCRWKGGKETVECTGRGLSDVPPNVDAGTQVLDLSDNNLQSLPRDLFLRAKLLNLQRVYLSNCNVGQISEGAFHRLTNLVELDLSGNLLVAVPTATFRDVPGLRRLILSSNPILKIDNNAFVGLGSLVTLELSRCQLDNVAPKAFHGLKGLANLRLDNNRLTTLSGKSIQPLRGLHSVDLHGNNWRCDCAMQDVKLWLTRYNIPYHKLPPMCDQPARVKGQTLDQLQLDDLACPPQTQHPFRRVEAAAGGNATLACEVSSNPSPVIQWYHQGAMLLNLTRPATVTPHSGGSAFTRMYVVYERGSHTERVSVLTVTGVSELDAGEYLCVAENKAGRATANFSLEVFYRDAEASGLSSGQIAGISIGLLLVGGIVLLLICVLLAKWRQHSERDGLKHPPLNQSQHKLMNSVNHVDYKGGGGGGGGSNHVKSKNNSASTGNGGVRMSFSLPRLSRSNSTQRNYSDEASDSDRTLIENLTSPSKSSTCNLSNKQPDVVVNLERNVSSGAAAAAEATTGRSRFVKDNNKKRDKKQQKADKEKRKEKHRWGSKTDNRKEDNRKQQQQPSQQHHPNNLSSTSREELAKNQQQEVSNNKCCNAVTQGAGGSSITSNHLPLPSAKSTNSQPPPSTTDTNRLYDDEDEDGRFRGSFGNLKISASSEWRKTAVGNGGVDTIENAGFTRDMDDDAAAATQESIELIEKGWGHSLCAELKLMNNTSSSNQQHSGNQSTNLQQQNHHRVTGGCANISAVSEKPSKNNSLMINAATSPVLVTSSGGGGGGGTPVSMVVATKTQVTSPTVNKEAGGDERNLMANSCNNVAVAAVKNANANATRFRHYVPVLPPLPAQHYSQVRNSLIRTCNKDSSADDEITDM